MAPRASPPAGTAEPRSHRVIIGILQEVQASWSRQVRNRSLASGCEWGSRRWCKVMPTESGFCQSRVLKPA
jgi:hypothetical protein